jgi:hypothetical protein
MEGQKLEAAEFERVRTWIESRVDTPAPESPPKKLDLLAPLLPLFARGELARRLAAAAWTKQAPSPSESDSDLYARFRAAGENAKEWPGLRSEYNKVNGAHELFGASIKQQCEEEKTPAARGERTTVSNPVRVYATQFWLHRDDMGRGAMLPEHEAKFGKAPVLAETPDGRLHLLDGHHRLFYHLREGGQALSAFVFEISAPSFQENDEIGPSA